MCSGTQKAIDLIIPLPQFEENRQHGFDIGAVMRGVVKVRFEGVSFSV